VRPFKSTLFGPSGGLLWHWRALRAWRQHADLRDQVERWLLEWQPSATTLVLVGPSAGWTLPYQLLERFSKIIAIDLDPASMPLFWLLHGRRLKVEGIEVHWIRGDFVDELPRLLWTDSDYAVLFCNVLGQLGLERNDYERVLDQLPVMLQSRHWASYHDRFSTAAVNVPATVRAPFTTSRCMDEATLLAMGCRGEWTDHGTGRLFVMDATRTYLPWLLTSKKFHWLEAGTVSPTG
jgi:hypothetical protein